MTTRAQAPRRRGRPKASLKGVPVASLPASTGSGGPGMGADGDSLSRIQERNRARLLEAALAEFSRHGYSGTTLDRLAAAAGMSKSNLLYYFSSKSDLYEASLARILEVWLGPLRRLDPEGDPARELAAYISQKMKMSQEAPDASRLFANEVMSGAPRIRRVLETDLKTLVEDKARVIRHWVETGRIASVDPVHLILSIWAITQHYADFQVQILAVTGKDLSDPAFRAAAETSVLHLVLSSLGLTVPAEGVGEGEVAGEGIADREAESEVPR